ncbi:MAG: DUF2283 domain-containing protein [Nitrosotalea sp.]
MSLIRYDKDAGAMYIKMREDKVSKTIPLGDDKFLDINEKGEAVGLEVLFLKNALEKVEEVLERSPDTIEIIQ